jgi:hypothetical protein
MLEETVIEQIQSAFGANPYPGDRFLQGSLEGCEPFEEVGAFVGKTDWTQLNAAMLDQHYCALGFFSEAGFRFFLPAYLIADLRGQLQTADPVFHLTHGFVSTSIDVPVASKMFRRSTGGEVLLNPRRYGAMTWADYARQRLSVFPREEAQAIVVYLRWRRERNDSDFDRPQIDAALDKFWAHRAANAPTRASLEAHLHAEYEFAAALRQKHADKGRNHDS